MCVGLVLQRPFELHRERAARPVVMAGEPQGPLRRAELARAAGDLGAPGEGDVVPVLLARRAAAGGRQEFHLQLAGLAGEHAGPAEWAARRVRRRPGDGAAKRALADYRAG